MTLILAWKDKRNVLVVADTAVTRTNVSDQSVQDALKKGHLTPAFGEQLQISKEKMITEEVLKIHNIKNKLIIGYAGIGVVATDVINYISEEIDSDFKLCDLCALIKEAVKIYGSTFTMIVGVMAHKTPVLFTFNESNNREFIFYEEYVPVILGNKKNDDVIQFVSHTLVDMFFYGKFQVSPDRKLIMACSLFQGILIRAGFLSSGVGGLVTGAFLNRNGFHWQKDVMYIKFDIEPEKALKMDDPQIIFPKSKIIFQVYRDGVLAAFPFDVYKKLEDYKVLYNYVESSVQNKAAQDFLNRWRQKYESEIISKIKKFDFDFLIFLCVDKKAPNKMTFASKKSILAGKRMEWENGVPIIKISKELSREINPMYAEYFNQFHWLPD
ncbi:hypothetical protein [Haliscomenobacter hydrossis]|uniref:Uncharacterized protein n=1 Tax=Haliscomenobacter hydrossis (strain ATCC 27775 / DSM 1100 / LMG 10767 / O) TaxID=760192 RepID=F4L2A6_HALH1|nr:hypothetical protein [Haliscomenobacter hydrossis]AEE52859.1 hypothetical protein Halhy_5033 [Haliscomenobacter hydrossis DSM 1100]